MRSLAVESLSIRGFRNLRSVDVELGPAFNVLSGDNGQGKTNLLEAAYVLATSRSFRTAKLGDLIAAGGETASIRGRIAEDDDRREQSIGLRSGLRAARIDSKRPPTLAAYALRTPTVAFHPGAIELSCGAGTERRRLLDRVALHLSPASLVEATSYRLAMRARQRVLETRGEAGAALGEWEELMVRHGVALAEARASAAAGLIPAAESAFQRIGPAGLDLCAEFVRGAPMDPEAFRTALQCRRAQDRARRSAAVGPHRDDLALQLGGRPVRRMASQGQHRAVVLALQLAEIEVVARTRDVRPILLLDDVSSELDRARTGALLSALRERCGQVLLTTTRAELIETEALSRGADRRDFRVANGVITAA